MNSPYSGHNTKNLSIKDVSRNQHILLIHHFLPQNLSIKDKMGCPLLVYYKVTAGHLFGAADVILIQFDKATNNSHVAVKLSQLAYPLAILALMRAVHQLLL